MTALAIPRTDTTVLFGRWRNDADRRARDELIRRFLPLTRQLARRYAGAGEPFDDLMQVASLALVKAIDRFDPNRGTAFSSFAVPTILGELKRHFRDLGWSVHVPRGLQEQALKVERAQNELTTHTGRAPSVQQLAEYLELSIEEVLDALQTALAHHSTSLDAPRQDDEGELGTLSETLGRPDERFELIDASVTLSSATKRLSSTERRVLALRINESMTQTQVAKQIGVSQMQVSRIQGRALAQLRELTNNDSDRLAPARSR